MRMKSLLVIAAVAMSSVASAELLLWQVGTPILAGETDPIDYDYAVLRMYNETTGVISDFLGNKVGDIEGDVTKIDSSVFSGDDLAFVAGVLGSDASANSFFIELYKDNESVGHSELLSYEATERFRSSNDIMTSGLDGKLIWSGTAWSTSPVPEPTSGLLLLVGTALLGLRRKKAV